MLGLRRRCTSMCQASPVNEGRSLEKLFRNPQDRFWLEFLVVSIEVLDNVDNSRAEKLKHQAFMGPIWAVMGELIE